MRVCDPHDRTTHAQTAVFGKKAGRGSAVIDFDTVFGELIKRLSRRPDLSPCADEE